ncbi:phosphatidate cytidylyltransferase [Pelagibius marinus]|uniref:phosphatidate cytidylyltransferase n=1 Tax=Pelagibius marinus TaxID=2762760 RepID=UPI00187287BA|nr:phosphatidate cytidylyltransferase [Pelagibius marinus]
MLVTRIISALVLAPLVLLAIWFGSWWFAGLVVLAAGLMGWELVRMCNGGKLGWPGVVVIAGLVIAAALFSLGHTIAALSAAVAAALIGAGGVSARAKRGDPRLFILLGTPYIGIACLAFLWLRSVPEHGRDLVFWLLAVVWATDIGAYFAGRGIGGPKLAPKISPNKTWAGLIGGALAAGLVGALAAGFLGGDAMLLVVGGMILAIIAQGGDLLESWCKRHFGVKDSSHIIPGHGGILDRVDGLLAVFPVAFVYFWAVGAHF